MKSIKFVCQIALVYISCMAIFTVPGGLFDTHSSEVTQTCTAVDEIARYIETKAKYAPLNEKVKLLWQAKSKSDDAFQECVVAAKKAEVKQKELIEAACKATQAEAKDAWVKVAASAEAVSATNDFLRRAQQEKIECEEALANFKQKHFSTAESDFSLKPLKALVCKCDKQHSKELTWLCHEFDEQLCPCVAQAFADYGNDVRKIAVIEENDKLVAQCDLLLAKSDNVQKCHFELVAYCEAGAVCQEQKLLAARLGELLKARAIRGDQVNYDLQQQLKDSDSLLASSTSLNFIQRTLAKHVAFPAYEKALTSYLDELDKLILMQRTLQSSNPDYSPVPAKKITK